MTYDKGFIVDMDGVIYKTSERIPGALEFIEACKNNSIKFLFLTNNSYHTPDQLVSHLRDMDIDVSEETIYTSAMATASFLAYQNLSSVSAYIIGGDGLRNELEKIGVTITDKKPDYVIVGESEEYDYRNIIEATHMIQGGARFIATNPDITGPTRRGPVPACGALVAPIAKVTGVQPYFIGKPNPAMMYWGRKRLGVHSANCFIIGDRMDTDIIGGLESGMTTCLVLTGVTTADMVDKMPYKPDYTFESIGDIDPVSILSRRDRIERE